MSLPPCDPVPDMAQVSYVVSGYALCNIHSSIMKQVAAWTQGHLGVFDVAIWGRNGFCAYAGDNIPTKNEKGRIHVDTPFIICIK
jgi:hypothetical protein